MNQNKTHAFKKCLYIAGSRILGCSTLHCLTTFLMSNLNKSLLAYIKPRPFLSLCRGEHSSCPSSLLPYASLFLRIQFSRNTLMRCFYFNELVVWWIGILPHPSFFVTETNWNRTWRAEGIQRHPSFSFHRWGTRPREWRPGLPTQ